jgi:RimJ/RimL family protein N-acetyltransferase
MTAIRRESATDSASVRLFALSLACLRDLVAGDLEAAERDSGLAFRARIWPDDADMREGLSVHLAACERSSGDLAWRVFLIAGDGDTVVGHAGFKGGPTRAGELEIYWCVEPRWRGRGIATAAAASLCQYAFAQPRVTAVSATIARVNVASQHVAVALGMENAGEVRYGMPLWRVARADWPPVAMLDRGPLPEIVGR